MLGSLTDDRDEATGAMRDAFAVLGDDDPLVPEFRRKLSNALF
jgi:thioredoxin-like negative regulator of GroEL